MQGYHTIKVLMLLLSWQCLKKYKNKNYRKAARHLIPITETIIIWNGKIKKIEPNKYECS